MPRVKIQLADNIKRVVVVDTEATRGATIGTNVYNPDGSLYVPASGGGGSGAFRAGYGILFSGNSPKTVNVNRAADFAWQGQHSWEKPLWVPDGAAASPGVAFGPDHEDGLYRIGANNVGIATDSVLRWDVNTTRTYQTLQHIIDSGDGVGLWVRGVDAGEPGGIEFSTAGTSGGGVSNTITFWGNKTAVTGFRFIHDETLTAGVGAYFELWRVPLSAAASKVFRVPRDAAGLDFTEQPRSIAGTAGAPSWSFTDDPNTGWFNSGSDELAASAGGTLRVRIATTQITTTLPWRGDNGSASAPTFSFFNDNGLGLYRVGSNNLGITASGTLRWDIDTTRVVTTLPHRGPNGSGTAPTWSFSGATGTGIYHVGSNVLGLAANSGLRFQVGAAGQLGIGGATYGTANTQAIVSGGASAAPSWQTVLVDGQTQTLGGAKTWTGNHRFSGTPLTGVGTYDGVSLGTRSTLAEIWFSDSGAGTDAKIARIRSFRTGLVIDAVNDSVSAMRVLLEGFRSGAGWTSVEYGNATDYPLQTMYGRLVLNDAASGAVNAITFRKGFYGIDTPFVTGANWYTTTDSMALGTTGAAGVSVYTNNTLRMTFTSGGGYVLAAGLGNYADDTAAAAGGIAVNQLYRNGSVVMIRVS